MGPSCLSGARGTPSLAHPVSKICRLALHASDCGGPIMRRSSRKWKIWVTPCVVMHHLRALATALNIFGVERITSFHTEHVPIKRVDWDKSVCRFDVNFCEE